MKNLATVTAFVATAQPERAKRFYRDTLGLRLLSDDQFAVVFDCAGIQLRIQKVETLRPQPFTALGWQVPAIHRSVAALAKRGVVFERYGFMEQDELGVWQAPSGARVAWFKDPDGNLLSLTENGLDTPRFAADGAGAEDETSREGDERESQTKRGVGAGLKPALLVMPKKCINPSSLFPSVQHGFSQVVVASGGRTVFVSGQTAWDADKRIVGADLGGQAQQALRNVKAAVESAGGTLSDIVALRIYIVQREMENVGVIGGVLRAMFATSPPASTWIGVSSLAVPEFLIEIEAVAVVE